MSYRLAKPADADAMVAIANDAAPVVRPTYFEGEFIPTYRAENLRDKMTRQYPIVAEDESGIVGWFLARRASWPNGVWHTLTDDEWEASGRVGELHQWWTRRGLTLERYATVLWGLFDALFGLAAKEGLVKLFGRVPLRSPDKNLNAIRRLPGVREVKGGDAYYFIGDVAAYLKARRRSGRLGVG